MDGRAHFVHIVHVGLERWWCVVGRRIGPVCDPAGASDLGGLAIVGGSDQHLVDGHLNHDFVPWPIQGWHGASLVVALDHVALWPSATSEPPLPGVKSAEMRLLEELLLLMPWGDQERMLSAGNLESTTLDRYKTC